MARTTSREEPERKKPAGHEYDKAISFLILVAAGLVLAALAVGFVLWLAGQLSSVLSGHGWPDSTPADIPHVLWSWLRHPGDPAAGWPAAARGAIGALWLLYPLFLVLLVPLTLLGYVLVKFGLNWRRRREFRLFRLGFASGNEIRKWLSERTVIRKAKSVRPSYRGRKHIRPEEVGFFLGKDIRSRQRLYSSVEDVFIILAPPRQGKDVHFCAPFTIDAPGAAIVTSTRADAFSNTYAMRSKVGRVLVFDPNGLTNWPDKFRWSVTAGAENPPIAAARAAAILAGAGLEITGAGAYFIATALTIIRIYLHAAAVGKKTMRDVMRWSTQPTNPEPVAILRQAEEAGAAARGWAAELESTARGAPNQVAECWSTVARALTCFADPAVLESCSPEANEVFDMAEFLSGRNTLYILGKEQKAGSVAALVTAMLEDMFDQVRRVASRMPGSRCDPPLTVELNEAAHIAPLPNLPAYMGDSGGFSISLHVYLQSLSQARARWGEHEAMIMWDNAAVRIIMGGAGNIEDLEDVSRLMGDVRSPSKRWEGRSEGRRVLSAEEIRTLEFGTAVIVARAARPVEATLTPWWKRKDGGVIAAGKAETERLILEHTETADRNNPYLQYLR